MAVKLVALAALLAVAQAGVPLAYPAAAAFPAIGAYSAYGKVAAPLAYAAPAYHGAYAAPAYHGAYAVPAYNGVYGAPVAKIAAPLGYAAPIAKVAVNAEYDPNPQYSFSYAVSDAVTGDNKHHEETRSGDVVQGSYSLVEADGTRRVVEYNADPVSGFNAVVRKEGAVVKAAVAAPVIKYAAPLQYAPTFAKVASPFAYAAPVAKYAAPLQYAPTFAKVATPFAYHG